MIPFILKALVFDFVFSFVAGVVLVLLFFPVTLTSKLEDPSTPVVMLGYLVGGAVCAVQGIMIAAAVHVALGVDPSRWDPAWYILGFGLSFPLAMSRGYSDPQQRAGASIGILASNVAYVLACIAPQHIPPFLSDTAVRLLL